jgi:hypothetical protein
MAALASGSRIAACAVLQRTMDLLRPMEGAAVEALMDRLIPAGSRAAQTRAARCSSIGSSPAPLAAALAALGQYRLQAMDNQAKAIQTKLASANAGTKQQTGVSP